MVIVPASANTIGNLANGLAPDPLTSIYLATKAKILIAPAMNGKMWDHPATQRNLATLAKDGCHFIGPEEDGMLACGYEGKGRLQDVSSILEKIAELV
jgi:phosphopantothenoylcysteine synthetase/decarboxylase